MRKMLTSGSLRSTGRISGRRPEMRLVLRRLHFRLTCVAQKRPCLNFLLTSNVRTVNGTPIMVITGVRLLLF